jgi:hypothetical protein
MIWSSKNEKKAQNVVFNLKGRISLLFYCVNHIHGQFKILFKTPKWRNIHFKQIAKTIPTVGQIKPCRVILLKPFCFVSYRYLNFYDTSIFLIRHVFIVLYGALPLYCFFETCKVKSVLQTLFRGIR